MAGTLERATGYQDDPMNVPVADVDAALPFYERLLGFHVLSRADAPHRSAVLGRDQVKIGLAENGGDATQDGCAFHLKDLDALHAEFRANGLEKIGETDVEQFEGAAYRVFLEARWSMPRR